MSAGVQTEAEPATEHAHPLERYARRVADELPDGAEDAILVLTGLLALTIRVAAYDAGTSTELVYARAVGLVAEMLPACPDPGEGG